MGTAKAWSDCTNNERVVRSVLVVMFGPEQQLEESITCPRKWWREISKPEPALRYGDYGKAGTQCTIEMTAAMLDRALTV